MVYNLNICYGKLNCRYININLESTISESNYNSILTHPQDIGQKANQQKLVEKCNKGTRQLSK